MKGGTLFSGIGAPEIAAPWIDWRWAAETDPFASAVHRERFPKVPNLGDVNRIDPDAVEPVDIVVFGSPCQSFSVAGRRLGLDDPRGNLALVALRLIGGIRPNWMVFENVTGLLSSDGGRDFGAFLGLVAELGYGFGYRVLDAQYFGVPQRRRRIFVVGRAGDWRRPAAVLFEPASLRGDNPPSREAGERVARPIASCPEGGSGWRADADTADSLIADTSENRTYTHEGTTFRGHNLISFSAKDSGADAGEIAPTLRAGQHQYGHANAGVMPAIAYGIDGDCLDRSGEGANGTPRERPGLGVDPERAYAIRAKRPGAVAFGGNNRSGPIDTASALNGHGGPHGRMDFTVETFIAYDVTGTPATTGAHRTDTHTALRSRAPGRSEANTTTMVVTPVQNATRGKGQNGLGVGDDGDPMYMLDQGSQHAVLAFKPGQSEAAGGVFISEEYAPTLQAINNGSTAVPAVAFQERGRPGGRHVEAQEDLAYSLTASDGGGRRQEMNIAAPVAFESRYARNGRGAPGDLVPPLKAQSGQSGKGDAAPLVAGMSVRRLTPIECERLQGFPDSFTSVKYRGKPAADGPRYRALGNSMAVPCVRWLLNRIREVDQCN